MVVASKDSPFKGGGCAGFKYEWGFVDKKEDIREDDEVTDLGTGKFFVVDEASMMYVAGTKVDWKECFKYRLGF